MVKRFNFISDLKNVKGWLTESEGNLLYTLGKQVDKNKCIVEIG